MLMNYKMRRFVGDKSGGGTPGPIPNPEVKPTSADGSMRATACESKPLPTSLLFLKYFVFKILTRTLPSAVAVPGFFVLCLFKFL